MPGYLPLIRLDSNTHMHGLGVFIKGRLSIARVPIFEIQGQKTNFNLIMLAQTNQRQQSFIYLNWFNSIILTSVKVDVSDRSVT